MDNKITQIRVEGQTTGLIGLESILAGVAKWAKGQEETDIIVELLHRTEQRNYIPSRMKDVYGKALLREYRKYLGQAVHEDRPDHLQVIILGPGCFNCTAMESAVRDVMAEMNLPADLTHITDAQEMGRYGVMGAPALIINNKIISVGIVPNKKTIRQWLNEAMENQGEK